MKRLELSRVRVCKRCGRGGAELKSGDGETVVVPLDAVRARQVSAAASGADVRSLTDLIVAELATAGLVVSEVVLDATDGRLGALVSVLRRDESEVVSCTADEGVALALRGGVRIYATDEALAHAGRRPAKSAPDTIH